MLVQLAVAVSLPASVLMKNYASIPGYEVGVDFFYDELIPVYDQRC